MKIEYLGHSSFLMTASDGTTLVIDPYTNIGYEMPETSADFAVCSHDHFDHSYTKGVRNLKKIISGTGLFTCGGFSVYGIGSYHDEVFGAKRGKNTIYIFEADGMRVCHMGDIGEPVSEHIIDQIGNVDVLMIPIGGTYTIDAEEALRYIDKIKPKVTVAMHFRCEDCTLDIATAETILLQAPERTVRVGSEIFTKENCGKILIPTRKK